MFPMQRSQPIHIPNLTQQTQRESSFRPSKPSMQNTQGYHFMEQHAQRRKNALNAAGLTSLQTGLPLDQTTQIMNADTKSILAKESLIYQQALKLESKQPEKQENNRPNSSRSSSLEHLMLFDMD